MENGHHLSSVVLLTNLKNGTTEEGATDIIKNYDGSEEFDDDNESSSTTTTPIRKGDDDGGASSIFAFGNNKDFVSHSSAAAGEPIIVDNLIDLDEDGDHPTPSYLSPTTSVKMFNKSNGSSTLGEESGQEDFYEGVANGVSNGASHSKFQAAHNLLDTPITPVRGSPFNSSMISSGSGKRLSSNALANHLYFGRSGLAGGGSSTRSGSRRSSFNSDVESMSTSDVMGGGGSNGNGLVSHSELSVLSNQMAQIQQQLESQMHNEDKHVRLKQENAVLQERVNTLEEQIQLSEERWRLKLTEEERKYRELLSRTEREKLLELDANGLRHQLLEREHAQCSSERQKLLGELDQLKRKCDRLEETVADLQEELEATKDTHKSGEQRLWKQKEDTEKRLRMALETCEELRREADHLRKERGYVDGTASEMEEELQRLKEEQKRLRETNDELHAELLQASVEQGRRLLSDGPSLAEEMDRMSKDQVMEALRDQEIVNQKLRAYVDGILLRIIEMHPAILEIKPGEKGLDPF